MPFIPNFPQTLLDEHMRWHHANHYDDPSQLPPGYGQNFLNFHRQFIHKVYAWYKNQPLDQSLIAPWQGVPEVIRQTACYDPNAEARVLNNPRSFATADELGLFIEGSNLHGCIHQEAARAFNEPALNDFDIAPSTTMFYNIHGMIDRWYRNWEQATGNARASGHKRGVTTSRAGTRPATKASTKASARTATRASGGAWAKKPNGRAITKHLVVRTIVKRVVVRTIANGLGNGTTTKGPLRGGPRIYPSTPIISSAAKLGTSPRNVRRDGGRSPRP